MSIYLSKGSLYREQENYAVAKSHIIVGSSTAVSTAGSVGVASLPISAITVAIPNGSDNIDWTIDAATFKILSISANKSSAGGSVSDAITVKKINRDGSFSTVSTLNLSGSSVSDIIRPSALVNYTYSGGEGIRFAAVSGSNCACEVQLVIGLV